MDGSARFKSSIEIHWVRWIGQAGERSAACRRPVELVKLQLTRLDDLSGALFNVGGGEMRAVSLLETTQLCESITGNRIAIEPVTENRIGDIPWFVTDARRVSAELNWTPTRSVRRTLEDIFQWIINDKEALSRVLE